MTARAYDPWGGHHIATNDNRPQTTKVEHVARALAFTDGHGDFLPGSEATSWHEPARAAIEAMRWPTERMLEVGIGGARGVKLRLWQMMIDAALAEHDERRAT